MPDPMTRQEQIRALNRLTAACEAAAPALRAAADILGDQMAPQLHRLLEQITGYRQARSEQDTARDLFLSRFPDAQTMQTEVDRRTTGRPT